ncbi:MAG: hypothetical protein IJP06_06210 [Agathobacter sp.]|nr:hypothetical protein [Agathobacter sp.]
MLGQITFILGFVWSGLGNCIGWRHSVRKWLSICFIYNALFSIILAAVLQGYIKYSVFIPLSVVIYMLIWIVFSLIADGKVALLVNEIVSGLSATIFTIGTFLVNITLKNLPTEDDITSMISTETEIEVTLQDVHSVVWRYADRVALESLEESFTALLPIIGISMVCVVMVKLKEYWMEKYMVA